MFITKKVTWLRCIKSTGRSSMISSVPGNGTRIKARAPLAAGKQESDCAAYQRKQRNISTVKE